MTIQAQILVALEKTDRLCDDCLSEVTGVSPRQSINMNTRAMATAKRLSRAREDCSRCRRVKTVNRLGAPAVRPSAVLPARSAEIEGDRPWYWEGNVQRKIVAFLRSNRYVIESEADTASRQQGKDIIARDPAGRLLWVTVKGFPNKSKYTQAAHWLAGALHDLSRYRDEDEKALLAMGLPAGFKTYEGLVSRHKTVRRLLAYKVYWVGPDGTVTVDEPA
jgi:hypothetical protein